MSLKIVRNDIIKMNTEAIVNTASADVTVGDGCDYAVYTAAGYEELLAYREANIGCVSEGEAFLTPGFALNVKYIIHAVSPLYVDGGHDEERLLRSCYQNSLKLAQENNIKSIAIPLISTGSFGYPKEEGMRIAVDEINAFLMENEMDIFLVVFEEKETSLGRKIYPDLEAYIDENYVDNKSLQEYGSTNSRNAAIPLNMAPQAAIPMEAPKSKRKKLFSNSVFKKESKSAKPEKISFDDKSFDYDENLSLFDERSSDYDENLSSFDDRSSDYEEDLSYFEFDEQHESKLQERMLHISDTFSQYLMYLIKDRNMENADVWKRGIVDKKVFSKIKNNPDYHPQKITALCLCVGAMLNIDETKDLLARAGYALSPCDKTDIIFSYFIENEIYDMIEIDIQLEEHGLPCIIS